MQDSHFTNYSKKLLLTLETYDWTPVSDLASDLQDAWKNGKQVFLCGNGGSAGNAIHLANDLIYGISKEDGIGLKAHALPANQSILTCLANDLGYENIFSHQLSVLGEPGDLLIVMSGSGNSPNILKALEKAGEMGVKSYAILGYSGGKALKMADIPIHFLVNDMQIAENCQQVVGHMLMQWLYKNGKG